MIHQNEIISYYKDFQNNNFPKIINRIRELKIQDVHTIIGARKVGKTYFCYQKISDLMNQGIRKTQILHLNFEVYPLYLVKADEFNKLLEIYWSLYPDEKELYLFIDEPQVIDDWQRGLLGFHHKFHFPMIITGSSSKLLSTEIASSFRGISIKHSFFSLSFEEFLRFKDFHPTLTPGTNESGKILNYQEEFFEYGGYPKVVLELERYTKLQILREYMDLVILKDIIQRFNIRNDMVMRTFISILMKNIAHVVSINKIFNNFKSRRFKLTIKTLYNYIQYLEDALIFFPLRKYHPKYKEKILSSYPKFYIHDLGLVTIFSQKILGRRLENAVFMSLYRRKHQHHPVWELYYYVNPSTNKEIDFLVMEQEEIKQAIQVSWEMSEESTWEREFSSLVNFLEDFKLNEGWIITNSLEEEMTVNGKLIHVVPFWKWDLADN